jgi:hypothetical protein
MHDNEKPRGRELGGNGFSGGCRPVDVRFSPKAPSGARALLRAGCCSSGQPIPHPRASLRRAISAALAGLHDGCATKPLCARREIFSKQSDLDYLARSDQTMGSVMWRWVVGGIALAGLTIEMIEGRWLAEKVHKDLNLLRTLTHFGHHWDALRGKWGARCSLGGDGPH